MSIKIYITIITANIENLLSGGLLFGWSSMNYVFTEEGYFNSTCNDSTLQSNSNTSTLICPEQQYNLQLVYTIAGSLNLVFQIVGGVILDRFGTWFMRTIGCLLFIIGCLFFAFSTTNISWVLYPALALLAIGGIFLFISNIQIANLMPKARGTIISLLNGSLIASSMIPTIGKTAYENGYSLKTISIFMCFLGILSLLRTYFLMPKTFIPYRVANNFYYGIQELFSKTQRQDELEVLLDDTYVEDTEDTNTVPEVSLKSCVFNSIFLLGSLSAALQQFRIMFFVAILNSWLKNIIPNDKLLLSFYISFFGYIQVTSLLFAPLNGALFDILLNYYNKSTLAPMQARYRALCIVCLMGSLASAFSSICALISSAPLQYFTFVSYVIANVLSFSNISSLIIQCFPMKYFGTLFGVVILVWAAVSTLQYPLYYIAIRYLHSNFLFVNILMSIFMCITFSNPINLFYLSTIAQAT